MTVDEDYKIIYRDLLENIQEECHDCKHLYLDYEYYEDLNDEFPFLNATRIKRYILMKIIRDNRGKGGVILHDSI